MGQSEDFPDPQVWKKSSGVLGGAIIPANLAVLNPNLASKIQPRHFEKSTFGAWPMCAGFVDRDFNFFKSFRTATKDPEHRMAPFYVATKARERENTATHPRRRKRHPTSRSTAKWQSQSESGANAARYKKGPQRRIDIATKQPPRQLR